MDKQVLNLPGDLQMIDESVKREERLAVAKVTPSDAAIPGAA